MANSSRRHDNGDVDYEPRVNNAKKDSHISALSTSSTCSNTSLSTRRTDSGRRRDLIRRTLAEDYPGLDYLGFHNVLSAKNLWYRILWFTIVTICLIIGLYTIYRICLEYINNPSATLISVKSLLLPQLTVCATHAGTVNLALLEGTLFHVHISNYTQDDVLNFAYFMLAGSGFQKMKSRRLDSGTQQRMARFYDIFRGRQSVPEFFNYFMDTFGLQCREFLQDCRLGDEKLDCCKVFEPEYLMRRGRCFRSVPLYQKSYDELGKFRVSLRQPFSMDPSMPTDEEVLAFLAEHKRQIAPFPRYYLYPDTWTKARISARRISLFPAEEICSEESSALSKDACYIQQWLRSKLEEPHNCTYPYMHYVRNVSLPSCHPLVIVQSYENTVEATSYTMHSCILACERWEYMVVLERTPANVILKNAKNLEFTYRIDVSYNDLQYEEIREVSTVTLAGLIAQIGGQLSLFMGSSILNLTQFIIMVVILTRRALWKRRHRGTNDQMAINTSALQLQKFENSAFEASGNVSPAALRAIKDCPRDETNTKSGATSPIHKAYKTHGGIQGSSAQKRSQRQDQDNQCDRGRILHSRNSSPSSPPPLPPHYDAVNRSAAKLASTNKNHSYKVP